MTRNCSVGLLLTLLMVIATILSPSASAASGAATVQPQVISDSQLQAMSTTLGGASVLPTTRTIAHWWGSTLNPDNGVVYGYNMVGANPNTCSGSSCSVTIQADITPVIVNFRGLTFSGNDVLAASLSSPQFATNDYGTTPAATAAGAFRWLPLSSKGRAVRSRREMRDNNCNCRTRPCGRFSTRQVRALIT